MKRLILVGFAGSGKNTVGEYLVEQHGYTGLSFADALKDSVAAIFCWDRQLLEGVTREAREWRERVDPWWATRLGIPDFTPRYALRHFGTEVMREHFHTDVWTLNVEKRILDLGEKPVVVFDGRFVNEIDLMNRLGGKSVRVKRGPEPHYWNAAERAFSGDKAARQELKMSGVHESEWNWIGYRFDAILENDASIGKLRRKVDRLLEAK